MVFIGGNKRQVKNELLEIICLSLEKFLTSIPFHKVGKNVKDFLLLFAICITKNYSVALATACCDLYTPAPEVHCKPEQHTT